jgi:hypothetical protein
VGIEDGQAATVTIVDGANAIRDTYTAAVTNNAWSIGVTAAQAQALVDGNYTVQANVSDAAGNPAVQATQILTVDATAPTIAVDPIVGDNTVNLSEATAGFTITGTTVGVEDGQTATVTILDSTGTVVESFTPAVGGNVWSAPVTPAQAQALVDGLYTVKADVSDSAGNPAVPAIQALTVNETVPGAPSAPHLAPASDSGVPGDSITNVTRPIIIGSAEAGSTVNLFDGPTLIGSGTADAVTGAWTITATTPLTAGANTLVARATDAVGNTSASSNPLTVTLDTTAPTVSAVAASPGTADLAAGRVVTLTLTLSEAVTVVTTGAPPSLTLNDGDTASYVSGSGTSALVFSHTVLAGQDATDLAVTGSSLNGGTITDAVGNAVDLAAAVTNPDGTLRIDTTAPAIAVAAPIAGDNTVNAGEAAAGFAITGTTLGVEDGRAATITIVNNTNVLVDTYTAAVTNNAWSIDVTAVQAQALVDASYTVQANVSDAAGNPAVQAAQALTVDATAPTIAVAPIAVDNTVNLSEATAGFVITGTTLGIEDGRTATITISDSTNAVVRTDTTTVTGNAWLISVGSAQATALTDGSYRVTATVSDAAGNPALPATQSLTVDETSPGAPDAPRLAPASDSGVPGDNITNVARPTITGTAAAGDTLTLFDTDGATVLGTAVAAGGTWTITPTKNLSEGAHRLTVTEEDVAGNTSVASAPLKMTIDTAGPSARSIVSITTSPGTAILGVGATVILTLTLSEPVIIDTAGGLPSLTLNDGGTAVLTGINAAHTVLTARYTVLAGQNTADLAVTGVNLNGATITDLAGNQTDTTGAAINPAGVLQIETAAPPAPSPPALALSSDSGVSDTDGITNITRPIIAGSAATGDLMTLFDTDGATVLGTATAVDGAWSITPTVVALSEGTHSLTVTDKDVAGNTSLASAPLQVTIDTVGPNAGSRRQMTVEQLRYLGTRQVVYLKAGTCDGETAFLIYSADGTPIMMVENLETAMAMVAEQRLFIVAVH